MRSLLVVMALGWTVGCASPPPPVVVAPPPPKPAAPIPGDQYVQGFVTLRIDAVFTGAAALESGLHWLVSGVIVNQGNREIAWLEADFRVTPKGGSFKHIVIDPLEGQDGVAPGNQRGFTLSVCPLEQGIAGEYDVGQVDWPEPGVSARVMGLKFTDGAP